MNSMTHDMSWDVIQDQQGQAIQAISETEIGTVSGGGWFGVAINAWSARRTCGSGNVKSVTSDGFTCK